MDREVIDLDVLRPPPQFVKLGGNKIDISFIPCALTFEVDRLAQELGKLDLVEVNKGGKAAEKAFDIAIDLCAVFCSAKHPEMTKDWFMQNTDPVQINRLAETIQSTLQRSYAGAEAYSKNQ
jgi:hypothetical protein